MPGPASSPKPSGAATRALAWRIILAWVVLETLTAPRAEPAPMVALSAWGSDHVGKALPEYVTGDECLFCHRVKVGPTWGQNRHQSTLRPAATEPEALAPLKDSPPHEPFAELVEFVLGRTNQLRFLKRSEAYGKLDLLSTRVQPGNTKTKPRLEGPPSPRWHTETFAGQCAGCHATALDSRTKTFSAISLDCYSCHGDVDLDHTKDTSKVLLARQRNDPARVVTSICASCHIRTGRSRSTGAPYPNNFVPGDNLFRDFEVDFSDQAIGKLNAVDRHILENVRDVVVRGQEEVTCLTCHSVHLGSSLRHRSLRTQPRQICWTCHDGDLKKLVTGWSSVHSEVCGY